MSRRNTISWPYGAWGFVLGAAFLFVGWAGACGKTSQGTGKLADGSVGGAGGSPTDAAAGTDVLTPTPADAGQSGGTTGTGGATQTGGTGGTGGVVGSGGSSAPGGSGGQGGAGGSGGASSTGGKGGGAGGSGGTSSTGGPDASADRPPATMGSPCSSQADCGLSTGMYLMCRAPGESMGCGICRMGPGDCSIDSDCVGDGGSTTGTMICELAPSSACYCNGASFCVVGCRTNANCGSGQVCNPSHTCENTCAAGTCPVNYSCTAGGYCQQNSCTSDSDCSGFCVKGSCYQTRGTCQPVPA